MAKLTSIQKVIYAVPSEPPTQWHERKVYYTYHPMPYKKVTRLV